MSFLTPLFLFGALAAVVPIVLHFLRRERLPRVPFSDLRLLRGARIDHARRLRLRDLLLLALRAAALVLLALAFARPFVAARPAPGGPATVVLVDTSFSLSAPGQADEARALARAAIDAAPAGHLVGVVAFDDAARVAAGLAFDRGAARAAVEGLSPRPRGTRYREGLAAASALIGDRSGRVVVVTDLQAGGWGDSGGGLSPHIEVETRRVAAPVGNLAVVGIDREPAQTAVRLWRWGSGAGETRLTLAVDGVVLHDRAHQVASGASTIRLPVTLPDAGVATVAVSDPSGYPADDRRYRRLDPADAAGVLLVTEAGVPEVYLKRALASAGPAGGTVPTVSASDLGRRPDLLADAAVVVLAGTHGLDRAGRERLAAFVRGGGGLLAVGVPAAAAAARAGLLGADAEPGPEAPRELMARTTLRQRAHAEPVAATPADRRHPVVRALGELAGRLGEARFSATAAIDASAGAVVLSFTDGAPALVDRPVGAGRVLVFASDLRNEGNDLPRQPVFVPFLQEVVRHLAPRPARPREFIVGAAPPGAPDEPGPARLPGAGGPIVLNVDTRESAFAPLTDEAFRASVERFARAGESVAVPAAGRRERPLSEERPFSEDEVPSTGQDASSTEPESVPLAEREAAPLAERESAPSAKRQSTPPEEAEQGLWRYLLLAMALALVAEGLLAARTS